MRYQQADNVEVRLKGHIGDQEHMGSVHVRTRNEVRFSKPSFRVDGGAIRCPCVVIDVMSI